MVFRQLHFGVITGKLESGQAGAERGGRGEKIFIFLGFGESWFEKKSICKVKKRRCKRNWRSLVIPGTRKEWGKGLTGKAFTPERKELGGKNLGG